MIEQLRAASTTLTGLAAGVPMGTLNVLVNASRPSRTSSDIRWRDHKNDVVARRMRKRLWPERGWGPASIQEG